MKKNILVFFVFIFSVLGSQSVLSRTLIELEHAFESESLYIRLSDDLTGIIKGKRCEKCEIELVKITPNTKLEINGLASDLIRAKGASGKPALVIYDIKTREVKLISLYR